MTMMMILFLLLASSVTVVSGFVVVVTTNSDHASSCSTRRSSSSYSTTAFLLSPPFQQQQQSAFSRASSSSSVCLAASSSNDQNNDAETSASLQELFRQHCDKNGLLTKDELLKMEFISDLLSNNDLLEEELDDIWSAIQKKRDGAIDVSSFVQIYQDIDDLFDDDSDDSSVVAINDNDDDEEQEFITTDTLVADDEELKSVFYDTLCDENSKLITKQTLREWSEVTKLLSEGLLGEDEFDDLWDKTANNNNVMNVEQFLSFNAALDDLFVFDEEDAEEAALETTAISSSDMITGEDLPPSVLFAALANPKNNLVGRKELEKWAELQQMLDDEELLPLELQNIYEEIPKAKNDMLDEAGFTALWESIDALFEDVQDDNDDEKNKSQGTTKTAAPSVSNKENEAKSALLSLIEEISSDDERLPCGLESTEREERQVQQIVSALEESTPNIIRQKQGKIDLIDLAGEWELLYSSSSAMKFNKGLSGLGGSVPNGRFGGLVQTLKASKYLTDVEYLERIEVNPSSASFDVRVTGGWDLRTSVSLFTGAPSTVLTVEPDKVTYGPTSTRADHWKSLGPLNMLDVTYLDDDLRVMRGNTSTDTIFVFRRKS